MKSPRFNIKVVRLESPLVLPKITKSRSPNNAKATESNESSDSQDKNTLVNILLNKQRGSQFRRDSEKLILPRATNDENQTQLKQNVSMIIPESKIFPPLNKLYLPPDITQENDSQEDEDVQMKKKKKKKKRKDQQKDTSLILIKGDQSPFQKRQSKIIPPLAVSSQNLDKPTQFPKFGGRKFFRSPKREAPVFIIDQEIMIKKYSHDVNIIYTNGNKFRSFVLFIDIECLGFLDETYYGYSQNDDLDDEEVKQAFNKYYVKITSFETPYIFYIHSELKDRIQYFKKMFSLVLILKKENKIFNEVVKYVDGWFDNIIEIKRAHRYASNVDYSQVISSFLVEGHQKRFVIFQSVDFSFIPFQRYFNNPITQKFPKSAILPEDFNILIQKMKEIELIDSDLLESQIPWFSCPQSQVRVVLLQRKTFFRTMKNMLKHINSPNFNGVFKIQLNQVLFQQIFGIQRLEHAIISQMNDLQLHSFLSANICYRIKYTKILDLLRESRLNNYQKEKELIRLKQHQDAEFIIQRNEPLLSNIVDIKTQFLLNFSIMQIATAEDVFDRNQQIFEDQLELLNKMIKKSFKKEEVESEIFQLVQYPDLEYAEELQASFIYIFDDY